MASLSCTKDPTVIKSLHDEAFLYISQGLSYQEQDEYPLSRDMYARGIDKIKDALSIRCDRPYCTGSDWDKARSLQYKMRKSLQVAQMELDNVTELIRSNPAPSAPPPTYEEACIKRRLSLPSNGMESKSSQNCNAGLRSILNEASSSEARSLDKSEVSVLFSVPGVQIFFISSNHEVMTSSSTHYLYIYKFRENDQASANLTNAHPSGWLQVGNWTYPLVPGRSPALESGYGAFIFPDIDSDEDGASVGLIFPANVDMDMRAIFKKILQDMTMLKEETQIIPEEYRQESFSDTLSRGIVTGAGYLSSGLIKGASITSKYIHKGASMLKDKVVPESSPIQVDPKVQQGLAIAKSATDVALKVSGFVATKICELTMTLGTKMAPHIREQGAKLLVNTFNKDPNEAQHTIDGVLKVAAGGFQGFSTVYMGLQDSAKILAVSLSSETVNMANHKYGGEVGQAVGNAVSAVGNLALTTVNVHSLGVKSIAKRTAKDTGKAILKDYVDINELPGAASKTAGNTSNNNIVAGSSKDP